MCVSGYPCEPHNNPADFFLDVINGDFTATTMTKVHGSEGNAPNFPTWESIKLLSYLPLSRLVCLIYKPSHDYYDQDLITSFAFIIG